MDDKKSLGFWLGIISAIIVVVQVVCKVIFNFEIEVNILVDIVSLILAILVMFGVIKHNTKSKKIAQIKKEIEQSLSEEIEDVNSKQTKLNK